MTRLIKSYSELSRLETIEERYEYLRIGGSVGEDTFGHSRYLNQIFYNRNKTWLSVRDQMIIRDNACDLGVDGFEITSGKILVHHINPISLEDILNENPIIFDPENLITVSHRTHNAIHYGNSSLLPKLPIQRKPNDTCLWRRGGITNV